MRYTFISIMISIILICCFTVFYPIETSNASSTIYVNKSNTAGPWNGTQEHPYQNIQDGINAADSGDTVYVYSGTYYENIEITKDLTLTGANKDTVILDGGNSNHALHAYGTSGNKIKFYISGFTIRNAGGEGYDCVILSYVNEGTISNNKIQNSDKGDGISIDHCDGITISDNSITDNDDAGIRLTLSENNVINENTILNNDMGIYLYYSSNNNNIYDNVIDGNSYGVKISSGCTDNTFYLNKFTDNTIQNAQDSSNNNWYFSSQGNYWDDYSDYDSNNDGIGDSPYTTGGVNDQKPLGYFLNPEPEAYIDSISPNPATEGDTINFNGHGIDDGTIIAWEWTANDNLIKQQEDFSYSGLSAGTYDIGFRVQDNDNDWSDWTYSILLVNPSNSGEENQKPTASIEYINPSSATYGTKINFSGTGTDADGSITEYYWSSNIDGYLSDSASFSRTDLSVGTHTITFKVKDDHGASSDEVYDTLTINPSSTVNSPPVAVPDGPYDGVIGEPIIFDGSNSYDTDSNDILTFSWGFNDGTTKNGEQVTHSFNSIGEYSVTLTVTDSEGGENSKTTTITITEEATNGQNNNSNNSNNESNGKWVIPGFDLLIVLTALIVFIIVIKTREKS